MPYPHHFNPDQILDTIHMVGHDQVQHNSRVRYRDGRPQLGLMLSDEADHKLVAALWWLEMKAHPVKDYIKGVEVSPSVYGKSRPSDRFSWMKYRGIDYTAVSLDDPTVMVSLKALRVFTNEGLQVYLMPFIRSPEAN